MTRVILALLAVAAIAAGASKAAPGGTGSPSRPGTALRAQGATASPGTAGKRVNPLRDPRGIHPGLSPVPASEFAKARTLIDRVSTALAGSHTGYARTQFGISWTDSTTDTWGGNGCKTREDILRRDLKAIDYRAGTNDCVVLTGILQPDPYTGRLIEFSKARPMEVQIDHMVPLSYAWGQGASGWSVAKRTQLANDPLNLLAVDGPSNQAKGDSGPAEWLPATVSRAGLGCAYAVRFAMVARRYRLPVQPQDKSKMRALCGA